MAHKWKWKRLWFLYDLFFSDPILWVWAVLIGVAIFIGVNLVELGYQNNG